ncbi:nucleolar protein 14 [Microdochium trichocladiopsis]|uniref:Nucleolar protein 14 n=1 Tax=Microdochium trichocladiopsis TaxID=1682393 RepID=A0A9P9BWG2_9PEZI|nr:nucleolar protein 14 [Microdochium trichocladiopsis]KAH7035041.1 nucleolar protein 14 [Microdochium trichocladiopsis]
MAGSQLKRLKASLREQGVIGPQKSKKQRKQEAQGGNGTVANRHSKNAQLAGLREQFNPFDLKHNVRGPKFDVTTNRAPIGNAAKGIHGRPSEAKALGEERRRQTLLVEMNRRNKVGGIEDKRFGENDPTLAPEDKMLERFAREKQRSHKRGSMFDLEDDDEPTFGLTHMGKSLSLDGPALVDDFNEDDLEGLSDEDGSDNGRAALKRMRELDTFNGDDGQPERKKSKQEVMKELIAKSKAYKHQRQEAKDADEDLREELDKELPDLHALLFQSRSKDTKATTDGLAPDTAAQQMEKLERDYDMRLRQLAQDRKAQPTERTKTEEEQAEEESKRLKQLEEKRMRRMQGEDDSESENENDQPDVDTTNGPIIFQENEEEDDFGLGSGIKTRPTAAELGFDDEDDFLIEDDLVASGSELDVDSDEDIEDESMGADDDSASDSQEEEDDDEFTKGLLNDEETNNPVFSSRLNGTDQTAEAVDDARGIPYTFACPETHADLCSITENIPAEHLPVVVQRIRALYHPKLNADNKAKLGKFSVALVQHLAHLGNLPSPPPFSVLESLTRHLHSLAKTYALEIATAFRQHLEEMGQSRALSPLLGDLVVLTAIGTIFPTSDHFHQVATPAMLSIARYLGQKVPKELTDLTRGTYMSTLALQYQKVAKRYVPEVMNFSFNTLCALAPIRAKALLVPSPLHEMSSEMRILQVKNVSVRSLRPTDCVETQKSDIAATGVAIVCTTLKILDAAADLWTGKAAFLESFTPVTRVLGHYGSKTCRAELPTALNDAVEKLKTKLERMLRLAQMARRPLELHHHKPLAIKTAIPKFEDSFDPTKHYDPDRERAELAKLKKEHKRERKGALRELRKDANFMAREKLRVKKVKDAAYEKKYRRLVAEIQGEEGREANQYEREKEMRKRANKKR